MTIDPVIPIPDRDELYRAVSELTSEFAYADRVEADGTITPEWVTPAFTRITGYSLEELIGREQGFLLVHQLDMPAFQRHVDQAMGGWPDVADVRIVTKSGDVRWIRSRLRPVWSEEERRVVRLYGAGQDVTEQKRAESELRLFADAFRGLPVGVCVWRLEDRADRGSFRLIAANGVTSAITGSSPEPVLGKTMTEAFPTLLASEIPDRFLEVVTTGVGQDLGDIRYGDDRTAERVYQVRVFPLPDDSVGVAFEDGTERLRSKQSLASAEIRFDRAFQSSPAAMLLLTADHLRIADVNQRGSEFFGYPREDMVGRSATELGLWAHAGDQAMALAELKSGGLRHTHANLRRRDGTTCHALLSIETLDQPDGAMVLLMATEAADRRGLKR